MKDLLAGGVAALLVMLSAPLGAAGPAPSAVATAEAQPLTLTAELQPADGGVSSAVISYAWSVTPGLREALPAGPSLKLSSAQTQGMKPGQAYAFTLRVKVDPFEVPASCTVTVMPPEPLLPPNRQKVPVPIPRPGVKL